MSTCSFILHMHTIAQSTGLTRGADRASPVPDLKASLSRPVTMLVKGPDICQAGVQVQGMSQHQGSYKQG